MVDPSTEHYEHWYPTAAYLYTLHLDGPAVSVPSLHGRARPQ